MYNVKAEEIKARLTMPQVLSSYGLPTNTKRRIPCPIHQGKNPNFAYTDQGFICWKCQAHGSVIDFVMDMERISFQEAVAKLDEDFKLGIASSIERVKHTPVSRRIVPSEQKVQTVKERLQEAQLQDAYEKALDRWIQLDCNLRRFRPPTSDAAPDPRFLEALEKIGVAAYRLDCAEAALYSYRMKNGNYVNQRRDRAGKE